MVFKKDSVIGLDIGSSSVKMARFAKREDGLRLVKTGLKEFKICDNEAENEFEMLSALKHVLKDTDVMGSKVVVNINCPRTAIKKLTAPYMPRAELGEGIRLEAKNYFPFAIDDALLDFQVLGDVVEKGVRKYEILVAVSPRKTAEKYVALLGKAGIRPASMICTSYALQKIAEYSSPKEDETRCLVDIGELHTELIIAKGRRLIFSRKIPVAGGDFTRAMTGTLVSDRGRTQLSVDEAEKIKKETGLPPEADSKIIDGKISATQVLSMLRTPLEQLISEIERSFAYCREETGGGKVDSVILFGGGASLGGLIRSLSEGLGMALKLGDPLDGMNIEEGAVREREKISHRLELAIAGALSGAKGINLLPPAMKEETTRTIKRGTVEAIVTAVIIVAALLYVGMRIQLANIGKRISVARLELSGLEPQLKTCEARALAEKILVDEPEWEDLFKELSNILPEAVHLTGLRMANRQIILKGIVATGDEQALSNLIITLQNGLFDNVKLVSSRDLGPGEGIGFELKCWVDYENR